MSRNAAATAAEQHRESQWTDTKKNDTKWKKQTNELRIHKNITTFYWITFSYTVCVCVCLGRLLPFLICIHTLKYDFVFICFHSFHSRIQFIPHQSVCECVSNQHVLQCIRVEMFRWRAFVHVVVYYCHMIWCVTTEKEKNIMFFYTILIAMHR